VGSRIFVVTVGDSPARVVIEDVRSGKRTLAAGLPELAAKIAGLLEASPNEPRTEEAEA
jgi:hypothetical protein